MENEAVASAPEIDTSQAEALVMERKQEAAKHAKNVGDMKNRFATEMDDLMQNPQPEDATTQQNALEAIYGPIYGEGGSADSAAPSGVLAKVRDAHVAEMEEAADGKEGISLMQTEPGHLGQNNVGGGDESMDLSADLYAKLDGTGKKVEEVDRTFWHESIHGGQTDAPVEWLEGHAEIGSNEKMGDGRDFHRAGQPQELYRSGQDTVSQAIDVLDRETVEEGMTSDFKVIIRGLMESEDQRADELLTDLAA